MSDNNRSYPPVRRRGSTHVRPPTSITPITVRPTRVGAQRPSLRIYGRSHLTRTTRDPRTYRRSRDTAHLPPQSLTHPDRDPGGHHVYPCLTLSVPSYWVTPPTSLGLQSHVLRVSPRQRHPTRHPSSAPPLPTTMNLVEVRSPVESPKPLINNTGDHRRRRRQHTSLSDRSTTQSRVVGTMKPLSPTTVTVVGVRSPTESPGPLVYEVADQHRPQCPHHRRHTPLLNSSSVYDHTLPGRRPHPSQRQLSKSIRRESKIPRTRNREKQGPRQRDCTM